jgi:hypothetical protein
MLYKKEPKGFERCWLERIEQRSERRSEWKRLRRLQRHRQLYRLGFTPSFSDLQLVPLLSSNPLCCVSEKSSAG